MACLLALTAVFAMPVAAQQTVEADDWSLEIIQADCVKGEIIPPAVNIGPVEGVTFDVSGDMTAGGDITIVATLQDGYAFPDSLPDGWELIDDVTAGYAFQLDELECDVAPTSEPQRDTDADPTVAPTVEPPFEGAGDDVTGLPSTGSGPVASGHLNLVAGVLTAGVIATIAMVRRRRA
jgi:hypothetical protein